MRRRVCSRPGVRGGSGWWLHRRAGNGALTRRPRSRASCVAVPPTTLVYHWRVTVPPTTLVYHWSAPVVHHGATRRPTRPALYHWHLTVPTGHAAAPQHTRGAGPAHSLSCAGTPGDHARVPLARHGAADHARVPLERSSGTPRCDTPTDTPSAVPLAPHSADRPRSGATAHSRHRPGTLTYLPGTPPRHTAVPLARSCGTAVWRGGGRGGGRGAGGPATQAAGWPLHGRGGDGDPVRSRQATGSPAPTLGGSDGLYAPPSYDMNLILRRRVTRRGPADPGG